MSTDESLETRAHDRSDTATWDALEWANQFVKQLKLEFADTTAELPPAPTWTDYRRAMLRAVVQALVDSGASASEISQLFRECSRQTTAVDTEGEWTDEKNARRVTLIDTLIQQTLSAEEAVELEQLTQEMRRHLDTEDLVPIEGARRLHEHLLSLDDSERTSR